MDGPPRVLVVDDNADLRDGVAEVLEEHGFAVTVAATADEAVEMAGRGMPAPDVILLDLIMPGMTARRFVSTIRDHGGWSRAKVVLWSAAAEDEMHDFPAEAFLPKPFRVEHLLSLIGELLPRAPAQRGGR